MHPSLLSTAFSLGLCDMQIQYRDDGSVGQFKSDITLTEEDSGRLLQRKTISVNDPLRYKVGSGILLMEACQSRGHSG